MKEQVLKYIKEQTGMTLALCDYFTEIGDFNGNPYFNVLLDDKTCESLQMSKLERLQSESSIIADIQPNGVTRVAIVCYNDKVK